MILFILLLLISKSQQFNLVDHIFTAYGLAAEEATARETSLKITNNANCDIITTDVEDVDGFDWALAGFNPKNNFQGVRIPTGKSYEQREDVNPWASDCPFTMRLVFSDNTEEVFRVNQKYAIGESEAKFKHLKGKRDFSYSRSGNRLTVIVR